MARKTFVTLVTLGTLLCVGLPSASFAGGTIAGKVTYAGKPDVQEFLFSKFPNPKFCPKIGEKKPDLVSGDKRLLKKIDVGPKGALREAVVAVKDIEDKAFMDGYKGTDVVAEFCQFLPLTGVVVNRKNFHVENHDADPDDPKSVKGVLHNPHTFEKLGPRSMTVFNIALAEKGSKLDKPVKLRMEKKGSMFRLQCDQHEFMQSFFLPVQNPYYTVVGDDGTFEIKDVPPGKHTILAWHPHAGQVETQVEVVDGKTVQAELTIK